MKMLGCAQVGRACRLAVWGAVLTCTVSVGSARAQDILLLDEQCGGSTPYFPIVLTNLSLPFVETNDDAAFFAQLTSGIEWDLVIVDQYANELSAATLSELAAYVSAGGRLFIAYWFWGEGTPEMDALLAALQADFVSIYTTPLPMFVWDAAHPLLTTPNTVGDLTPTDNPCFADGGRFNAVGGAETVAGYVAAPTPDEHAIIVGNSGRTVLFGGIPGVFNADDTGSGRNDMEELLENAVSFLRPGPTAAYIRGANPPWGETTNEAAMDLAFGAGNWADLRMADGEDPFLPGSGFELIFLEGSDSTAIELANFLDDHRAAIEEFVAGGRCLLLNSAPNQGGNIDFGFGGHTLIFPQFSTAVTAADPSHPVFQGPFTPVATDYTGNQFGHAVIDGPLAPILLRTAGADPLAMGPSSSLEAIGSVAGGISDVVLGELTFGAGRVLLGGMTTDNWHSPQPEAANLRANLLSYAASSCAEVPVIDVAPESLSSTLDEGQTDEQVLTISNLGGDPLVWEIVEGGASSRGRAPFAANASAARTSILDGSVSQQWPAEPGVAAPGGGQRSSLSLRLASRAGAASAGEALTDWREGQGLPESAGGERPPRRGRHISGGLTFYFDRPAFEAAFPGLASEGFEAGNVAPGGAEACPHPADSDSNDACFSPGDIAQGIQLWASEDRGGEELALFGEGLNGAPSKQLVANFFVDTFEIAFTSLVTAAGFDLVSHFGGDTCEVEVFDTADVSLGSTTQSCNPVGSGFLGVESAVPIGRIHIASPTNQAEGVDNVLFGLGIDCSLPSWLSVDPTSGTVDGGSFQEVDVVFDATGLATGTYEASLCIASNDPVTPLVVVPIELTVLGDPCPVGPSHLVLENVTLSGTEVYEACLTITAGPNFTITSTGDVTFRAGKTIIFRNGVEIETGASFTGEIDPSLQIP